MVPEDEYREEDYSSNDEDNPANDYPEDEGSDIEYDYYRDYEDDDTKEMMREFERHCLDPVKDLEQNESDGS